MKKTINIMCYIPDSLDATAFYRSSGVFGPLKKTMDINYKITNQATDWNLFNDCDILFMQRPWSDECITMMWLAKNHKIPVWVDYDDELLAIGPNNKAFFTYQIPKLRENVSTFRKEADVVTVTNEFLAGHIDNRNTIVVPNAWPDHILDPDRVPEPPQNTVLWRGGDSHAKDLMNVCPQMLNLARKYKDWKFKFMGDSPSYWFIVEKLFQEKCENIEALGGTHLIGYYKSLRSMASKIHIVPLFNDLFNRSKSNCAWLEASWAGSTVVGPDFKEWERPGIVRYNTPDGFEEKVSNLIENWDSKNNEYSMNYIRHNLLLSNVNKKRAEIIRKLAG